MLALLASSTLLPLIAGVRYIPLGNGPDELFHLDYAIFLLRNPSKEMNIEKSFSLPNQAPIGQGHQPPLYYKLSSWLLGFYLSPQEASSFIDYQTGIQATSSAYQFGGEHSCLYTWNETQSKQRPIKYQNAIYFLKVLNALLQGFSILFVYFLGRLIFSGNTLMPLSLAAWQAGNPTALWKASFITNDNLVSCLGILALLLSFTFLKCKRSIYIQVMLIAAASGTAVLAFLSKYSGISALGILFLAILLKPSVKLKIKIYYLLTVILFFSLLASFYLYSNFIRNGSLFLLPQIVRAYPYLYRPSSFASLLFDYQIYTSALNGLWISFDNFSSFVDTKLQWFSQLCFLILISGAFGATLVAYFSDTKEQLEIRRIIALSIGVICCCLFVVLCFSTKFPLPGGRFMVVTLPAFGIIILFGLQRLLSILLCERKLADYVVFLLMIITCALGQALTFTHQRDRFSHCSVNAAYSVPSGLAIERADLDGDLLDEIIFYHRQAFTLYVAHKSEETYKIMPEWTRVAGLSGDILLSGDITGDAKDDVILYRPYPHFFTALDAKSILNHNQKVYPYPERSGISYFLPIDNRGQPLAGDINGDGITDLIVRHENEPYWDSILSIPQEKTLAQNKRVSRFFIENLPVSFLVKYKEKSLLASYDPKQGQIVTRFYEDLSSKTFNFPVEQEIVAHDIDSDGIDEILSWEKDGSCFSLWQFSHGFMEQQEESNSFLQKQNEFCITLSDDSDYFTKNTLLLPLKTSTEGNTCLAVFDLQTAVFDLLCFSSGNQTNIDISSVKTFNPGFFDNPLTHSQIKRIVRTL